MSGNAGPLSCFRHGFTFLEILVVVTILSLLALLGLVNVVRARLVGNETVTIANLRELSVALRAYHSVNNTYPDPLGLLSDVTPPYVYPELTGGSGANGNADLAGYAYDYVWEGLDDYALITRPVTERVTGVRRFWVDETSAIRYTVDGTDPTVNSPLIQ
ncbi:MAG: prepilin-type N-terminal cleavage/methylation domain-containing protein [Candidatus Omnitrophica bacterium]|nr:prepilin-type N-terminal cleavage/methylation domain-containing protein [Candidatus Omnitrophota bacterium]